MDVTTQRQHGILSAHVNGRIDGASVREFEETIRTAIEDDDSAVIIDFEKLAYISSAELRAVLMTAKSLWSRDAAFALCSLRVAAPGRRRAPLRSRPPRARA